MPACEHGDYQNPHLAGPTDHSLNISKTRCMSMVSSAEFHIVVQDLTLTGDCEATYDDRWQLGVGSDIDSPEPDTLDWKLKASHLLPTT